MAGKRDFNMSVHFSLASGQRPPTDPNAWYNNREGLEARLKDSLDGLREIAEERRRAHYEREETLTEWCILGRYYADSCGNVLKITKGAPADAEQFRNYEQPDLKPVITLEEMIEFTNSWVASGGAALPPKDATCDRCGKGWTIRNVNNLVWASASPVGAPYGHARHQDCHRIAVIENEREYFVGLLEKSGIPYTKLVAFPNQYCSDQDYSGPWFWVETPKGRIEIGWRKRVIHIDWSKTTLEVTGPDIVEHPRVTHGPRHIHAWGRDTAIMALRHLWELGGL
jgi:hypothetical protein